MTWAAEFLPSAPVPGTLPEAHFESDIQEKESWVWVRFTGPDEELSWAGCFRGGFFACNTLLVVATLASAFVVAGGQGYWVSLEDRIVRHQQRFVAAAASAPDAPLIVVADYVRVALLSEAGVVWRTRRLSLDGITLTGVSNTLITGEAKVPEGVASFEVDVASGDARGGWEES